MADISNSTDIISMDDITERYEELRDEHTDLEEAIAEARQERTEAEAEGAEAGFTTADVTVTDAEDALVEWKQDNNEELIQLRGLLDELQGNGGDHKWEGDWYPGSLIRDSYFKDYAQELAEDIGAIKSDAGWPYTCIDWEQAARELQQDYSAVEYGGITYWYR